MYMRNNKLKYLVMVFMTIGIMSSFSYSKDNKKTASNMIKKITIKGNQNIKEGEIKSYIKVKKRDFYNQNKINSDIKNILKTGKYEDIQVEIIEGLVGIEIIFNIKERPNISNISFQGNNSIKERKLKKEIESKKKDFYEDIKLKSDKQALVSFYKEKGFINVTVDSHVKIDKFANTANITFYINEEKKVLIGDILFSGNKSFKTKKILKKIKTKKKTVYKEEVFNKDMFEITRFYKNQGFLDVRISTKPIVLNKDKTLMNLNFEISEGFKYKFGSFYFKNNYVFSDKELSRAMVITEEKTYNQNKLEESLFNVREMYSEKGYIRMTLNPLMERDEERGFVNIRINVEERDVVYIDNIYIDGNTMTRNYVIKRELLVKEDDPFNVKKIRRSQERVFNLGFFEDVGIDVDEGRAFNKVDLAFNVIEQKTGMFTLGAGYSSQDKFLGSLQISEINFMGRGQRIDLFWEFGEKKENYRISFTEPSLFRSKTSLGIDIFNTIRDREYVYTDDNDLTKTDWYNEDSKGVNLRLGRRLSDFYAFNLTYGYEKVRIYNVDSDDLSANHLPLVEEEAKGEESMSIVKTGIVRDSRNNVMDPSRGAYSSFSKELAGSVLGGDNNFYRFNLTHKCYFKTFWEFVLAFNFRAGLVEQFSPSTGVPIYEKYYLGGAETLRGYDYRGDIGPESGGNYMLLGNVEYKFPLVKERKNTIIQGAFFFDIGNTWDDRLKITLDIGAGLDKLKAGFGFGIRFKTPVFPIRLDWGYGLAKDEGQFYFTVGQMF